MILSKTVTLDKNQIASLPTAPFEIIAAPTDGSVIIPLRAYLRYVSSAGAGPISPHLGAPATSMELAWGNNETNATLSLNDDAVMTNNLDLTNTLGPLASAINSQLMKNKKITLGSDQPNNFDIGGVPADTHTLTVIVFYWIMPPL